MESVQVKSRTSVCPQAQRSLAVLNTLLVKYALRLQMRQYVNFIEIDETRRPARKTRLVLACFQNSTAAWLFLEEQDIHALLSPWAVIGL